MTKPFGLPLGRDFPPVVIVALFASVESFHLLDLLDVPETPYGWTHILWSLACGAGVALVALSRIPAPSLLATAAALAIVLGPAEWSLSHGAAAVLVSPVLCGVARAASARDVRAACDRTARVVAECAGWLPIPLIVGQLIRTDGRPVDITYGVAVAAVFGASVAFVLRQDHRVVQWLRSAREGARGDWSITDAPAIPPADGVYLLRVQPRLGLGRDASPASELQQWPRDEYRASPRTVVFFPTPVLDPYRWWVPAVRGMIRGACRALLAIACVAAVGFVGVARALRDECSWGSPAKRAERVLGATISDLECGGDSCRGTLASDDAERLWSRSSPVQAADGSAFCQAVYALPDARDYNAVLDGGRSSCLLGYRFVVSKSTGRVCVTTSP
jgi:hypothetical protein